MTVLWFPVYLVRHFIEMPIKALLYSNNSEWRRARAEIWLFLPAIFAATILVIRGSNWEISDLGKIVTVLAGYAVGMLVDSRSVHDNLSITLIGLPRYIQAMMAGLIIGLLTL
jgi:hypothetical protein